MHRSSLIGMLILTATFLHAQLNLVPNPSFEYYIECPRYFSAVEPAGSMYPIIRDWVRPTPGSSDYFHACATQASMLNVPNNFAGYIEAKKGSGYCGIYTLVGTDTISSNYNYREYLQVQLLSPMTAGNDYCIGFYARPAAHNTGSNEQVLYATHRIGAYLSNSAVEDFSMPGVGPVLPYTPQVVANGIVSDTSRWTRVVGTYTAMGGEQWITIGNFFDDAETHPLVMLGGQNGTQKYHDSYYFIDDVSVYEVEHVRAFATTGEYRVCDAFPLTISASEGMETYLWNTGEMTQNIDIESGGLFWVQASFEGCSVRDTVNVVGYVPPVVDIGPDRSMCINGKETPIWLSNTSPLFNYSWSFGVSKDSFLVTFPGVYQLTTNHPCGVFSDEIEITGCNSTLYLPNIITPESNDINAVFAPSGQNVELLLLEIYDNWGHRLYRGFSTDSQWDGRTSDGRLVNPGVYVYKVRARNTLDGSESERIGDITVIR